MSSTNCSIWVMRLVKLVCGTTIGLAGGTNSILELTSILWSPLSILLITGSDMMADEVDGAEPWGSWEMDEVVGGSRSGRAGDMRIFKKSKGLMGVSGGNPLASPVSTIGSSWISTLVLNCRGESSPVRLTTGLDSATLALLAFGATMGFVDVLFPTSGVGVRVGELENTLGMGEKMEVVLGYGLDWET